MSHTSHTRKRNDTSALEVQLKDENGPVDLTGATVKFLMRELDGTVKVDSSATITDAPDGKVKYAWSSADVDTAADYEAEWEVTFSDSSISTFPSDGYMDIIILEDVA